MLSTVLKKLGSLWDSPGAEPLSPVDRAQWLEGGYLILRGFIPRHTVAAVNDLLAEVQAGRRTSDLPRVTVDVLHGPHIGRRFRLPELPEGSFAGPTKVNDLFLEEAAVRACNLHPALIAVLRDLLEGDPLVCNSLNFTYGSQQPPHYDTWYMPPPVENRLVASSILLDPMTEQNGPLVYYPGSHTIPPYRFSHGGLHAIEAEMAACSDYVRRSVEERGLQPVELTGEPGDVFLWHAQLLHGGRPIRDPEAQRRTLVTHYWRCQDVDADRVVPCGSGAYLRRDHHAAESAAE